MTASPGAALAVAAVLLWAPGALLGRALGLRRRWALVAAPALTWGAVALAAVAVPRAGLRWGPWTALGALAVALLLAAALRVGGRVLAPAGARPTGPDRRRRGAPAVAAAAVGWAVAAALVVATAWRAHHRLGGVAQTWDAVYHADLATLMASTGDSDPVSAPSALASAGWRTVETYYPSALHALAALVVRVTGAGAATALDVLVVLVSAAAVPAAAAALAGTLAPRRPGTAAAVAAVAAVLPVAYPVDPWWRGVWSYSAALAAAVLTTALVVRALDGRLVPGRPVSAVAVVLLALAGVAGLQPAGVVLVGVLVLGWALTRLAGAALPRRTTGRDPQGPPAPPRPPARRLRLGLAAAALGTALLPPLVLGLARWSPSLGSLAGYDWHNRPGTPAGVLDALGSVLGMVRAVSPRYGYAVPAQSGQWLLAGVVLLAVVLVVGARATAWLAAVWVVLVAAAVSTVAPVSAVLTPAGAAVLRSFTLFSYNAPFRLMAVVAVVSAVVVGVGAARAAGVSWPLRPALAVAVVAVLAVVATGSVERASVRLAAGYAPRTTGTDQLAVMQQLADVLRADPLPPGALVANDPVDGSAWLYALHGVPVQYRHHSAGPLTPDARLLLDSLDDVDDVPAVQRALRDLRVCYVYAGGVPVEDSQPLATGFTDLDGARLLQPVARQGSAAAYRVLVPGTPCAPPS